MQFISLSASTGRNTHQQADMCCRTYWGVLPKLWPKTFRHRRCRQTLSKCPSKSMHDIVIFLTDTNHNLVATEMTVGVHCGSNCWATPSTNFGNMLAKCRQPTFVHLAKQPLGRATPPCLLATPALNLFNSCSPSWGLSFQQFLAAISPKISWGSRWFDFLVALICTGFLVAQRSNILQLCHMWSIEPVLNKMWEQLLLRVPESRLYHWLIA